MSRPRRSLSRAVAALALCPLLVALAAPATASATATASGIVCATYHAGAGTASVRYGYSNVGATSSAFETVTELGDDFSRLLRSNVASRSSWWPATAPST